MTKTVVDALRYLAGMCDGASTRDGVGFSGVDAQFGKDLAEKGSRWGLSEKQHACARKLVHKYRRQLTEGEFDVEAIKAEVWEPAQRAVAPKPAAVEAAPLEPAAPPAGSFSNRYPGTCAGCARRVPAECGTTKKVDGRWQVRCPACYEARPPAVEIAQGADYGKPEKPHGFRGGMVYTDTEYSAA